MIDTDLFFQLAPYTSPKNQKDSMLVQGLNQLTLHHYTNCMQYRNMLDSLGFDHTSMNHEVSDIPFIPVSLFKQLDLKSIKDDAVYRTLYSSGTTHAGKSSIFLDKQTAALQQKALVASVQAFTGIKRLPMLIVDTQMGTGSRREHESRAAAVAGFSLFASDRCFALDEQLHMRTEAIQAFLDKHKGKPLLVFGFTYLVWKHFIEAMNHISNHFDLSNALLIHGGGWKKLADLHISNEAFKKAINECCGISKVISYFGMIEQAGSVFLECEHGHLHTSCFNDVLVRRERDFSPTQVGEPGLLQTLSVLPGSYCGHSLLTGDQAILLGEDDCSCGRKGKYFHVLGRYEQTVLKGCSDTYEA